jgi:hypothetical protein
VNARRAFPTRTGDLRPAAPSTETARGLAKTVAREVQAPRRPPHAASQVAAPKGDAKFSCLQRIEKAQNVEIFSTAEDGLRATKRGRGGSSLAAGFACARGAAIGTRGTLKGRQGKFFCLQPIEKAQNVEMFSATEDGLGANDRERGGSFARRTICMRPRHRHRRARRPEKTACENFPARNALKTHKT